MSTEITRREALRRAAVILGGALSASTVAGVLAGCEAPREAAGGADWVPRALSRDQAELVATIAEHIIPATDTPGARAAGVHRFVDTMLAGHYPAAERDRFVAGLEGVDVRARQAHQKPFMQLAAAEQVALLTTMDRDAYPAGGAAAQQQRAQQPPPRDPIVGPSGGGAGGLARQSPADVEGVREPVRAELRSEWFWRRMKELTLTGYYTSEAGATQELRVNPMGAWRGDVPYAPIGRSWA